MYQINVILTIYPFSPVPYLFVNNRKTKKRDPMQAASPMFSSTLAEPPKKQKKYEQIKMDEQHQNQKTNSQPQTVQALN